MRWAPRCPSAVQPALPYNPAHVTYAPPLADKDTFNIFLKEGQAACIPNDPQAYSAKITLTPPQGIGLALAMENDPTTCANAWPQKRSTFCLSWAGKCGADDSRTVYFQVSDVGGAPSCSHYTVEVQFCKRDTKCPGC